MPWAEQASRIEAPAATSNGAPALITRAGMLQMEITGGFRLVGDIQDPDLAGAAGVCQVIVSPLA